MASVIKITTAKKPLLVLFPKDLGFCIVKCRLNFCDLGVGGIPRPINKQIHRRTIQLRLILDFSFEGGHIARYMSPVFSSDHKTF